MSTEQNMAIVTGAAGWLGQRLVRSLVLGLDRVAGFGPSERRVRTLVLPGTDASGLRAIGANVEVVEGNVSDAGSLAKLFEGARDGTVFHTAGVIHPSGRTAELYRVNVDGTRNVLEAARGASVRRFVHVSSNSPIGTNPSPDHVFDESAPYHPYMKYGKTKMLAEKLVTAAHASGALETVIIRPPWFYGPGQPPRQTLFFQMIRDGKAPIVGSGLNRRSMAYVDNICQGLRLCERIAAAAGQVYWIADRRPYTMNEIVDTVERVLERDFEIACKHGRLRLPGLASEVAWLIDRTLQACGIYQQKIHVLSEMNKTIACSITKAERELGYAPGVDLELGMKLSLEWLFATGGKL